MANDTENLIHVTLDEKEAKALCWALSDVLCWASGFEAAKPGEGPMNISKLRDFNIKLKRNLPDVG